MRRAAGWTVLLACVLTISHPAWCDEGILPGHSHYGEAFDRGPRQSAYLMGGTGNVHFPVTTKTPLVQRFIEQGIGQLHGFWFVEAERSFRMAVRLDPDCGIAYWGMSLAAKLDKPRARQFAEVAAKHKAGLTEREKMYIDVLSGKSDYRSIIARYPQDLEAKAFEVWRIWHLAEAGGLTQPEMDAAAQFAKEILAEEPMHPIHHAVIHFADFTNRQRKGAASAGKCGESAPSIGHMWHMPVHIYYALKKYPEAAWQLEASMRTEQARMMRDRVIPDQVHLYAHNNEWLVRTLLHLGRVHDARRIARQMIDLPRHPLLNVIEPPEKDDSSAEGTKSEKPREMHGTSAYYGRERLLQVLNRFEYWDELVDVCKSGYIEPTHLPAEQGKVLAALGVADYSRGDVAAGNADLAELRKLEEEQLGLRNAALADVEQRPEQEQPSARPAVYQRFSRTLAALSSQIDQVDRYRRFATGFFVGRKMLIVCLSILLLGELIVFWLLRRRMAAAILTVAVAIGGGAWLVQSHLALLSMREDAIGVDFAYVTRRQLEAGDPDAAEWSARNFAKERPNQVRPQANLVEILYRVGKKDDALAEFETLRDLAGTADLDSPPLARLAPIARDFGFPTDWRLPVKIQKALEGRRPLPSLGPLLWRPWTAPDWALNDAQGREHALAEFRGKPVILVFFLGEGCLHCKQQLEAFVKKAKDFSEAGLTVVAISSDDQAGIKKSLASYKPGPFPFLMLADPKLKVFQAYRAYDDFEQTALHGTFLIDPQGLGRWQDVSFEPFMDVNFVLTESKRLLSCEAAPVESGARVIADAPLPAAPLASSRAATPLSVTLNPR